MKRTSGLKEHVTYSTQHTHFFDRKKERKKERRKEERKKERKKEGRKVIPL